MNALYITTEPYFYGDGTLYHFTKASSFFKILNSMSLKVSRFDKLNDLNEANLHNLYMNDNLIALNSRQYIKENCSLVCFTRNYKVKGKTIKGCNHPAMWAHYANNSFGACIALDENLFRQKNAEIFNQCFSRLENVKYTLKNGTDEVNLKTKDKDTPESFVKANYKQLFFKKHIDWRNEHERRLLMIDGAEYLDIDECVKYIVLGYSFVNSRSHMSKLKRFFSDSSKICSKTISERSFAKSNDSERGYRDLDINKLFDL